MNPDRLTEIEDLFHAALERPEDERTAFLRHACGEDPDLYYAVERLLRADASGAALLDRPLLRLGGIEDSGDTPALPMVGRQIGPYRIEGVLGHGGMGTVYRAVRADVGKTVALKLVKGVLAMPERRRRFLAEQRILAQLQHPHIAALLDAGVADDGTPFFALEYVQGVAIDRYCDAHTLGVEARLRLFETVCRAVQHAHGHFVVHRDLKPSNIMVKEDEAGRPVVKLLDFGIAKVLAEAEEEGLTRTGGRVLTPEYAAPEQVRGAAVTAATDVYALGVVLYELLTGRRPHTVKGDDYAALEAMLTAEAKRPSTAVTTTEAAAARATTTERLERQLRGDLDVICLKALSKEADRRYQSAEAFAEDVRRHLAGLPVVARPDAVGYRLRKFVRRHRVGVAVGVAFAVLLIGFSVLMAVQQQATARERDRAQQEATRANQVTQFLINVFEAADPGEARGDTLNAYQILERGVARLETEMAGQPAEQAAIQDAVAQVYRRLGAYDQARVLAEEAYDTRVQLYGRTHPDVAASLAGLGWLSQRQAAYAEADSSFQEALAIVEDLYGRQDARYIQYLNGRGQVLVDMGEYAAAESLLTETLASARLLHGDEHPEVAAILDNLSRALKEQGNYEGALPLTQEALATTRALYGNEHPSVAVYVSNLGSIYFNMGDDRRAEQYQREALALQRKMLGDDHPDVAAIYSDVASSVRNQGQSEEAITLYLKALDIMRRSYGDSHPNIASVLYNLSNAYRDVQRFEEAEVAAQEMLVIDREQLGEDHPLVGLDLHMLAGVLRDKGAYRQSLQYEEEALTLLREKLPPEHRQVGHVQVGYGIARMLNGAPADAEPDLRAGIDILRTAYADDHWSVADAKAWLGACLTRLRRYEEAETLLLEAYGRLGEERDPDDRYVRQTADHLVALYEAWGRPDQATSYR